MKNIIQYSSIEFTSFDEKVIAEGTVEKVQNDKLIICSNEQIDLKINQEILIHVFSKDKGVYIYFGVICNISKNRITVKEVKFLFDKQRRSKNRIIVNISLQVDKIHTESKGEIGMVKPISMTAKNLSSQGILLECNLDIPEEVNFLVELPIDNKKINVQTITKRKYEENNLYYYGCELKIQDKNQCTLLENFVLKNYNIKFFKYYK